MDDVFVYIDNALDDYDNDATASNINYLVEKASINNDICDSYAKSSPYSSSENINELELCVFSRTHTWPSPIVQV